MKRDILCKECSKGSLKQSKKSVEAGEHICAMTGVALNEYLCDLCGKEIKIGEDCTARSIWTDQRNDYYEWERQYVRKKE